MKSFLFYCSEIWSGKSVLRAFLNYRLHQETFKGKTIDIGGGGNPDYLAFVERESDTEFVSFDIKTGAQIDFETDSLHSDDNFYDTILFLNVLEHIYNYQHLANEVVRVLKPQGQLIGFVPFLMWYHPDHRDFFRYTHEALQRILENAGAKNIRIEPVAFGPFVAAAHMITQSIPRPLALVIFVKCYLLDLLFLKLRPSKKGRYALGYMFITSK